MKKMSMKVCASGNTYLEESTKFIRDALEKMKAPSKLLMRTVLLAEELIVSFVNHGQEGMEIQVNVQKRMGDIYVDISAPGREIESAIRKSIISDGGNDLKIDADDSNAERIIRTLIVRAQGEKLKYAYKDGFNKVSIAVGKAERSSLVKTVFALVLGIIVGLVLTNLVPGNVSNGICTYVLEPIKTIFMNALRIIVGPVVFFSLVTCLSQFKNLSELGRVFAKVMIMYMVTTVIAALIALGLSMLLQPGSWGAGLGMVSGQAVSVDTNVDTSLLSTIIGIVPDNFLKPFIESNTLQLIFLALITGIAVGAIGEHSAKLSGLFESLNELFLTVTTMISRFIPLAAFCSVVLMLVQLGGDTILSLLGMCGVFFASIACMIVVYGILVMVIGRLNPFTFFKKIKEGMLTSLALSSSSAAMPTNMMICTEKLGVSPKIASFSIPLGATINMDGTSINLIVVGLFLARMYGVSVSGAGLISMIVTVVLLSLGAPGVPGAGIVCLGIVLENIGVPIEAVALVMAIDPFLDMFSTMNNVTGDMAVTTIVGRTEGMLDTEVYKK